MAENGDRVAGCLPNTSNKAEGTALDAVDLAASQQPDQVGSASLSTAEHAVTSGRSASAEDKISQSDPPIQQAREELLSAVKDYADRGDTLTYVEYYTDALILAVQSSHASPLNTPIVDADRLAEHLSKPLCVTCQGTGWCEGSPAFTCPDCKGLGVEESSHASQIQELTKTNEILMRASPTEPDRLADLRGEESAFAWLIERYDGSGLVYWTGRRLAGQEFSPEAEWAVRFARFEDAEQVRGHVAVNGDCCRSVQHGFEQAPTNRPKAPSNEATAPSAFPPPPGTGEVRAHQSQDDEIHDHGAELAAVGNDTTVVHTPEQVDEYLAQPHRRQAVAWLRSKGFIEDRGTLAIAWGTRSGFDFTDLGFYPLERHENDLGWDVIIGHHASGRNPRMAIGTCENLAEVQETYDLIRRLNGYQGPEPERAGTVEELSTEAVSPSVGDTPPKENSSPPDTLSRDLAYGDLPSFRQQVLHAGRNGFVDSVNDGYLAAASCALRAFRDRWYAQPRTGSPNAVRSEIDALLAEIEP